VDAGPNCGTPTASATSTSSPGSPWCRSGTPTLLWRRQWGTSSIGHRGQIFFTNSGAESNECAIKLARKHGGRGRHTVVSALGSFHGRTLATLAATGQPAKHEPFAPMPEGFRHVPWGDLDAMRSAVDGSVAAVLIEPVQGEGGVHPATTEYLQGIRALCDEVGALMMVDEIQTGFGRTGRWFGFEHAGVSPDVVTLAKAMGNGMPVGACWARVDVAAVFQPGDHGSTYSGTAIATAAVNAVIDEMQRIDAPAVAQRQGRRLVDALRGVPGVVDVRGRGLMLGVELAEGLDAKLIYGDLLDHGLIVNAVTPTTLRLVPPITVTDAEIDEAVALIIASLGRALADNGATA
jgi:acetylornithine/N-succinyldiaminopimelate aminotransferase